MRKKTSEAETHEQEAGAFHMPDIGALRGPAAEIFRALLAELRAASDALRVDVIDAKILHGMLQELALSPALHELRGIARARVLVRFVSATIDRIDQKTLALEAASYGQGTRQ